MLIAHFGRRVSRIIGGDHAQKKFLDRMSEDLRRPYFWVANWRYRLVRQILRTYGSIALFSWQRMGGPHCSHSNQICYRTVFIGVCRSHLSCWTIFPHQDTQVMFSKARIMVGAAADTTCAFVILGSPTMQTIVGSDVSASIRQWFFKGNLFPSLDHNKTFMNEI